MNINAEIKKHTGTDQEIADAINADPAYWGEVKTDTVWSWLADAGRLYTLEQFSDSIDPQSDSPQVIGLKSAVRALLKAINNTLTSLDTAPGSKHRTLIDAVSAALSLDVSDLLAKGRPAGWVDVTAEQVAAAKIENEKADQVTANLTTIDKAYGAALDQIDDLTKARDAAVAVFNAAIGA